MGGAEQWTGERKVKSTSWSMEENIGDSCCWGVRTVETGLDCVWKLHGGV
jgi:hypothetical protein